MKFCKVDGKFWHNYPDGGAIDKVRNEELQKSGYCVIRFWEDEIIIIFLKS